MMILDQLPKEIRNKIDTTKDNLEVMCSTITLPDDYKPGFVVKWIRKVSQNELKITHDDFLKIRLNAKKLKRSERFLKESLEARGICMNSQQSEISSKLDTERYMAIKSLDVPSKIINYNITLAEDNSACSKTSSNTKPSRNLVRIPMSLEKAAPSTPNLGQKELPFYMRNNPKLVSVDPGVSFTVKFENSDVQKCNECQDQKESKPVFPARNGQDIVVERFDKPKVQKPDFLQNSKLAPPFPIKPKPETNQFINVLASVGGHNDQDSINFNWAPN